MYLGLVAASSATGNAPAVNSDAGVKALEMMKKLDRLHGPELPLG